MTTGPAKNVKVRSSLVRRLVQARADDPVKQRARAWLCELSDDQLSTGLGLTSEDIAALRGAQARARARSSPQHQTGEENAADTHAKRSWGRLRR
jgi:hypothetical protein